MADSLWYIRDLQNAIAKRAVPTLDGGFVGEREERVRLLRADADLREMELAKQRGLFVVLPDVESTLADLVLTTKGRIMAIPPRLAPELVGFPNTKEVSLKCSARYRIVTRLNSCDGSVARH